MYRDLVTQSGKKDEDNAWWNPGVFNPLYPDVPPYTNGDPMSDQDASKLFKTLSEFLKAYGMPPFKHEYTTMCVRKTGINLTKLLGYSLDEISYIS